MNVFNRLIVILLLIGIIALVVTLFIWPLETIHWAQGWLAYLETAISQYYTWTIILAVGIGIILLAFILILIELFARRPRKTVKVRTVKGGRAEIRTESIARRIVWYVDRLSDVIKVEARVRAKGGGVDVQLNLETSPDVNVPMKTEEVLAVVREQIENEMGLKLSNVNVKIKSAPFSREPEYVPEPEQAPAAPEPKIVEESADTWTSVSSEAGDTE